MSGFLGRKPVCMLAIAVAVALLAGCQVERTQEAKAPDVDVDVDPGRWPKYDVNWADVDVGTATRTVTVPEVEVTQKKTEVQVPYIDISPPGSGDREERTITVELEVPHAGYDVEIKEIRAEGDRLWVISQVNETKKPSAQVVSRVSDQVVIRAPEDLNIRRVVLGQRLEGVQNEQYMFLENESILQSKLPNGGGRVLYRRQAGA